MIKKETMLTYICDGCGERFSNADGCVGYVDYDIWEEAESSGWLEINGKHYCPDCYEYDENVDDYVAKPKTTENGYTE